MTKIHSNPRISTPVYGVNINKNQNNIPQNKGIDTKLLQQKPDKFQHQLIETNIEDDFNKFWAGDSVPKIINKNSSVDIYKFYEKNVDIENNTDDLYLAEAMLSDLLLTGGNELFDENPPMLESSNKTQLFGEEEKATDNKTKKETTTVSKQGTKFYGGNDNESKTNKVNKLPYSAAARRSGAVPSNYETKVNDDSAKINKTPTAAVLTQKSTEELLKELLEEVTAKKDSFKNANQQANTETKKSVANTAPAQKSSNIPTNFPTKIYGDDAKEAKVSNAPVSAPIQKSINISSNFPTKIYGDENKYVLGTRNGITPLSHKTEQKIESKIYCEPEYVDMKTIGKLISNEIKAETAKSMAKPSPEKMTPKIYGDDNQKANVKLPYSAAARRSGAVPSNYETKVNDDSAKINKTPTAAELTQKSTEELLKELLEEVTAKKDRFKNANQQANTETKKSVANTTPAQKSSNIPTNFPTKIYGDEEKATRVNKLPYSAAARRSGAVPSNYETKVNDDSAKVNKAPATAPAQKSAAIPSNFPTKIYGDENKYVLGTRNGITPLSHKTEQKIESKIYCEPEYVDMKTIDKLISNEIKAETAKSMAKPSPEKMTPKIYGDDNQANLNKLPYSAASRRSGFAPIAPETKVQDKPKQEPRKYEPEFIDTKKIISKLNMRDPNNPLAKATNYEVSEGFDKGFDKAISDAEKVKMQFNHEINDAFNSAFDTSRPVNTSRVKNIAPQKDSSTKSVTTNPKPEASSTEALLQSLLNEVVSKKNSYKQAATQPKANESTSAVQNAPKTETTKVADKAAENTAKPATKESAQQTTEDFLKELLQKFSSMNKK